MPTYKNNSAAPIPVVTPQGDMIMVLPGETATTRGRYSVSGLDLVSDAPVYNPITGRETVTAAAAGAQYFNVPVGTKYMKVWKVAGSYAVSVFLQALSNSPAVAVLSELDMFSDIIDGRADRVVLYFTGAMTCEVIFSSVEID